MMLSPKKIYMIFLLLVVILIGIGCISFIVGRYVGKHKERRQK